MARPTSRDQLLDAMQSEFERLRAEVDLVPPDSRQIPGACDAWSVKDLLACHYAWATKLIRKFRKALPLTSSVRVTS